MINFFKKLLQKELPRGKTYNMQDPQSWGDSIQWTTWPQMKVHGYLYNLPKAGDILICKFKSGRVCEFQFTNIEYCGNPSDMFFADVKPLRELMATQEKLV